MFYYPNVDVNLLPAATRLLLPTTSYLVPQLRAAAMLLTPKSYSPFAIITLIQRESAVWCYDNIPFTHSIRWIGSVTRAKYVIYGRKHRALLEHCVAEGRSLGSLCGPRHGVTWTTQPDAECKKGLSTYFNHVLHYEYASDFKIADII